MKTPPKFSSGLIAAENIGKTAVMRGSTISWEFEKINDESWLTISGVIDGSPSVR